jgi:hypothetical protein
MFGCADPTDEATRKSTQNSQNHIFDHDQESVCDNLLKNNFILTKDLYLSLENHTPIFPLPSL